MFTHILVPLDGSALAEVVLPHAAALAQVGQPEITLLQVLDPGAVDVRRTPTVDPFDWQLRKAEAESYLREMVQALGRVGVRAQSEVVEGRAADSILEYAQEHAVDLVVLSSHGQSGLSGWNISSVVQKICARIHRSVLVVRAYQAPGAALGELQYTRLLLPLDCSSRAEIVLPVAAGLARHYGGTLVAAHVVRQPEVPRRTPLSEEEQGLVNQICERNRAEADIYLDELPMRLNLPVETRLEMAESVTGALRRLEENSEAQLVIVSAHGYSGDSTLPYGSTATNLLVYGSLPLLVIQDLPADRFEPSPAEKALQTLGKR